MQRSILFVVIVSVLVALLSAPGAHALATPLKAPAPRAARGKSPLLEPVHRGSREGRYGPGMEAGHHHHPAHPRSDSVFVKYQKRAMLEPVQRANSRARYPPSGVLGPFRGEGPADGDDTEDSSDLLLETTGTGNDGFGFRPLLARLSGAGKRMINLLKSSATAEKEAAKRQA